MPKKKNKKGKKKKAAFVSEEHWEPEDFLVELNDVGVRCNPNKICHAFKQLNYLPPESRMILHSSVFFVIFLTVVFMSEMAVDGWTSKAEGIDTQNCFILILANGYFITEVWFVLMNKIGLYKEHSIIDDEEDAPTINKTPEEAEQKDKMYINQTKPEKTKKVSAKKAGMVAVFFFLLNMTLLFMGLTITGDKFAPETMVIPLVYALIAFGVTVAAKPKQAFSCMTFLSTFGMYLVVRIYTGTLGTSTMIDAFERLRNVYFIFACILSGVGRPIFVNLMKFDKGKLRQPQSFLDDLLLGEAHFFFSRLQKFQQEDPKERGALVLTEIQNFATTVNKGSNWNKKVLEKPGYVHRIIQNSTESLKAYVKNFPNSKFAENLKNEQQTKKKAAAKKKRKEKKERKAKDKSLK